MHLIAFAFRLKQVECTNGVKVPSQSSHPVFLARTIGVAFATSPIRRSSAPCGFEVLPPLGLSPPRGLEEEPCPPLGPIDPDFQQPCVGKIVLLLAKAMLSCRFAQLSSRSSASLSIGVTKSESLSATRWERPCGRSSARGAPTLRTRSAITSVVARSGRLVHLGDDDNHENAKCRLKR